LTANPCRSADHHYQWPAHLP